MKLFNEFPYLCHVNVNDMVISVYAITEQRKV